MRHADETAVTALMHPRQLVLNPNGGILGESCPLKKVAKSGRNLRKRKIRGFYPPAFDSMY